MLNVIKPWVVDWFLRSPMVNHSTVPSCSITPSPHPCRKWCTRPPPSAHGGRLPLTCHPRASWWPVARVELRRPDRILRYDQGWTDESLGSRGNFRRKCWAYRLTKKDVNSFLVNEPSFLLQTPFECLGFVLKLPHCLAAVDCKVHD